ncbi:centrosomal protein 295 isoform X3 [Genypterus blacodes]|uniref:centrosomal protein 295 isoform X3 n=1 Tax=Genypterus blacodes TaxID=154954 RepID=UPI003F75B3C0
MAQMKRKVGKLRPSPNEEAQLIRAEHERRRKLRIQQVREQNRHIALQIRREVEQRRQRELEHLEEELREDWERQQREKLHALQRLYQESLQQIGQGHRSAKENEPDWAAMAKREEQNQAKAEERYREALRELKSQRLKDHEKQSLSINARKTALQAEKERSARVASLPPPPPNPTQIIDSKKPHVVRKLDVNAFAATHYHMPETTVDREVNTKQTSANVHAEVEVRRLQELQREAESERHEQQEKARLRGKQALRREQHMQDRERLLVELEHMQQTDLLRRRQQVSQMPPQIFQPVYKRQEMREDFQRDMEFAFEEMYTGERKIKGDLVLQLVPEPLPALSTSSRDRELDVSLDDAATQETENTHDAEQEARGAKQETSAEAAEPSRPAPRQALKKLLERIRGQRNCWSGVSSFGPDVDAPTAINDQIPERDTTIDTGSLVSEERQRSPAPKLPEPQTSPAALETTETSSVADQPFPDILNSRIQEFEEERKKREEELELEKEQQVALLQELEEQKEKLEQMLLEAQQERDELKATVTQDAPANQVEEPVHDPEVPSVAPGSAMELLPPVTEDDHTRRIREYQQRLLQQNMTHKRSVEVARQRLQEYQRALQIRYNMTPTSSLTPLAPPALVNPHLPGPESALLLPPPSHTRTSATIPAYTRSAQAKPQTPVIVSTRDSGIVSPPPHESGPSLRTESRLLPQQQESHSGILRRQCPDVLTDSIMERVTEHLPKKLRPSVTTAPPSCKSPHHSTANIPVHTSSGPFQTISQSITSGTPMPSGQTPMKPGTLLHGSLEVGSAAIREEDADERRRELQDIQRRVLEQRAAVALRQRQQEGERQRREEERQKQEEDREQMRRQREALEALINTETQPTPEDVSDVYVSEEVPDHRLKLLASLLKAIEESNGGTLSHLEDHQEQDSIAHQQPSTSDSISAHACTGFSQAQGSFLPSSLHIPPRPLKPPVTRVRLGVLEMPEQHELSAIQEVETPIDSGSLFAEEFGKVLPHTVDSDLQEETESSVASDRTLHTFSESSRGQQSPDTETASGTSSSTPSQLHRRERPLMGSGTRSDSLHSDSALRSLSSPSSDSGRGDDVSGSAVNYHRSPTECQSSHRPPDPDFLSDTSISTGSYVTTDPEQNSLHTGRGRADVLDVVSPSGQSSVNDDDSAPARPCSNVDSLLHDSNIQRIIDRYTKELNISLNTAGSTTAADGEGSRVEEPLPSESQTLPSDTAEAQQSGLRWGNPIQHFSDVSSLVDEQGQDSFRPLIGQLADQSSVFLDADPRDSAMERLVGQPSAHSSLIGQLPCQLVSVSTDHGGWESTLSHMMNRLSHQPGTQWLSGGQGLYASQVMDQMGEEQSTTWMDEGREENQMRPLVGELDESADHQSRSSVERTSMDVGGSDDDAVPSYPVLISHDQSHSIPVHNVTPDPQNQTVEDSQILPELGAESTEVLSASDSFHPLPAEVTHNETADPTMTFHLPERDAPSSNSSSPPQSTRAESRFSTHAEELDSTETSAQFSEASPERFRAEEPSSCPRAVLHQSFCQLTTSPCQPDESVLMASPVAQLIAPRLRNLTVCDATPTLSMLPPDGGNTETKGMSERGRDSILSTQPSKGELKLHQGSHLWNPVLIWDKIQEAAGEKGILEQSDITLASLTDTSEHEVTITEEEECGEKESVGMREEGLQVQEELESTLLAKEDKNQSYSVMFLDFEGGPSRDLQKAFQHKRQALLQRSSNRVDEIKEKRTRTKAQPKIQCPYEPRGQCSIKDPQPISCRPKTKTESQMKSKLRGGQAGDRTAETAETSKPKPLSAACQSRLKKDEVKLSTAEQRKCDASAMFQRTQRLYHQLEEVKHQKVVRSRQDAYANNRLKAKEFHQKTLQKLRAKRTPQ